MELREYLFIIKKRLWIIILFIIIAVLISAFVSAFVLDRVYEAYTTLMVVKEKSDQSSLEYNDILLNQRLVKTYSEVAKSNRVLSRVDEELGLDIPTDRLAELINVESVADTEVIKISAEHTQPQLAVDITNKVAEVFMEEIVKLMKMENVQVIDEARVPVAPVKPRTSLNIAIAFVVAIMAGLGLVFLLEYLDNTIKTPEDVERHLGLPTLGNIPLMDE
ncbi:MAG TPA: lipopolysaccharide biosynthesis protein [Clostridiales bacterium]|nr:lipopolysaccharide biosynthesis protein [Clostridiales bacterium]